VSLARGRSRTETSNVTLPLASFHIIKNYRNHEGRRVLHMRWLGPCAHSRCGDSDGLRRSTPAGTDGQWITYTTAALRWFCAARPGRRSCFFFRQAAVLCCVVVNFNAEAAGLQGAALLNMQNEPPTMPRERLGLVLSGCVLRLRREGGAGSRIITG